MTQKRNWSYEETLGAFYLYHKLGNQRWDKTNEEVVLYAAMINRTVAAVEYKFANLRAWDPTTLKSGFSNGSKFDMQIWQDYKRLGENLLQQGAEYIERLAKTNQ